MGKAVILDIDETLAHSKGDIEGLLKSKLLSKTELAEIKKRIYVLDHFNSKGELDERLWGIKRPHLDTFLKFCFDNFDLVIVWSAGAKWYVDRMVRVLFTDAGHPMPHYVFSREDCLEYIIPDDKKYDYLTDTDLKEIILDRRLVPLNTKEKMIVQLLDDDKLKGADIEPTVDRIKPLKYLYSLEPSIAPIVSLDEMIIIDNKESNFIYNMSNALLIEDYAPDTTVDGLLAKDDHLIYAIEHVKRRLIKMTK